MSTSFHVKFQERFQPKADYIHKQPDITNSMRCILIDWLVEVCDEFKLDQHTLYLGISIVDRWDNQANLTLTAHAATVENLR